MALRAASDTHPTYNLHTVRTVEEFSNPSCLTSLQFQAKFVPAHVRANVGHAKKLWKRPTRGTGCAHTTMDLARRAQGCYFGGLPRVSRRIRGEFAK